MLADRLDKEEYERDCFMKKKIGVLVCLMAMTLALTACGNPINEISFRLAEKTFMKGDFEKAIEKYEKILDRNEDEIYAYMGIASAYYQMGQYEEGAKILAEGFMETESEILYDAILDYQEETGYIDSEVLSFIAELEAEDADNDDEDDEDSEEESDSEDIDSDEEASDEDADSEDDEESDDEDADSDSEDFGAPAAVVDVDGDFDESVEEVIIEEEDVEEEDEDSDSPLAKFKKGGDE